MRKTITLFLMSFLVLTFFSQAQTLSGRQERYAREDAKQESKRLEKEGYVSFPGDVSIRRQLELQYLKRYATDENGLPAYLLASATSVALSEVDARKQALQSAKTLLAGQLSSKANELIEQKVSRQQLSRQQAFSLTKYISSSRQLILQQVGEVMITSKFYRQLDDDMLEVSITIAYSQQMADKTMRRFFQNQMAQESEQLSDEVDKLLDQ